MVRYGLRGTSNLNGRILGFVLGTTVLFVYSLCVNIPRWDFGRLMGFYIALFFVVSQVVTVVLFKESLKVPTIVGGALVIAGGLVLTLRKAK